MILEAHAKINLSLDILGRRPNGYHDVSMVMQSVELSDTVSVVQNDSGEIIVKTDCPHLSNGSENLAYKACQLMIEKFGITVGFDVEIQKRIPLAGGMAGGSTDAAAVLKAINQICDLQLSVAELMELGLSLGADVPFCIYEKPALATGIGEILTPICGLPADTWILLVNPYEKISTKTIYEMVDESVIYGTVDNGALIQALEKNDLLLATCYMKNVMETVSATMCPSITEVLEKLKNIGACHSMMSGSGATCFGLFTSRPDVEKARQMFPDYYVELTKSLTA